MPTNIAPLMFGDQAWGDLDGDGDMDLVYSGWDGSKQRTILYWNEGGGRFRAVEGLFEPMVNGSISFLDFDHDGKLDVSINGENNNSGSFSMVYRNEGAERFSALDVDLPKGQGIRILWEDYDDDGDWDLFFNTVLYRNENGVFKYAQTIFDGSYGVLQWVDLDGDGKQELIVGAQSTRLGNNLLVFENRDGTFVQTARLGEAIGSALGSAQDLDGDGRAELLVLPTRFAEVRPSDIFTKRNGGWESYQRISELGWYTGSTWGDVDNDGVPDLLLYGEALNTEQNRPTEAWLFRNQNGFLGATPEHLGLPGWNSTFVDFDSDGDLDIFRFGPACWNCETQVKLLENQGSNSRPSPPGQLQSEMQVDGAVRLTWSAGSDLETTNAHYLTYDVRVGTRPNAGEVVSPPVDWNTGARRITGPGGAQSTTKYLKGLSKGTYYWSVQTVDTAYSGSSWASEASFVITNTPPTIGLLESTNVVMSALTQVAFTVADLESQAGTLLATAQSETEELLPNGAISISGVGQERILTFQPAKGKSGVGKISVTVQEPGGLLTRRSMEVVVEEFTAIPAVTPEYEVFDWKLLDVPPADYDGDGDLDVYASGQRRRPDQQFESFTALLKNDGHGRFSIGPDITNSFLTGFAGDFNHDGRIDLLGDSVVNLNNGDGTFSTEKAGQFGGILFLGDLNGDGEPDIVTRSDRDGIYLRRGSIWEPYSQVIDPHRPGIVALNDFDRDGNLDLLIGGYGQGGFITNSLAKLFFNSGNAVFTNMEIIPNIGENWVWAEDHDSDGDLDIVSMTEDSFAGPFYFVKMANDGNGKFSSSRIDYEYGQTTVDYNNDGHLDFFLYEYDPFGSSGWRLRRDSRSETNLTDLKFVGQEIPKQIADFDNDGDLDFLAVAPLKDAPAVTPFGLVLFRNNADRPNRPPEVPRDLRASIENFNDVNLDWGSPLDDNTPSALLTYNLRVGRIPNGIEVVAPFGLVAQDGNAGHVPVSKLHGLAAGKYFWSVQALDGQFQASAWAPERTFIIDTPAISPITDFTTAPGEPTAPIRVLLNGDAATAADELSLSATSDSPDIIPADGFELNGSGAERRLVITPGFHTGSALVELTARGTDGKTGITRFRVTVDQFERRRIPRAGMESTFSDFTGWANHNFQWVDVDGDGQLDLLGLFSADLDYRGAVWRYAGNGELIPITNALPIRYSGRAYTGDVNGDNHPDFYLMGDSWSDARIWTGGTNYQLVALTPMLTNGLLALEYSDRDHDGLPDTFFWPPRAASGYNATWFIEGPLGLSPVILPYRLSEIAGVAWSDLDGDGDLDLLISGSGALKNEAVHPTLWVWKNDAGKFALISTGLPTNFFGAVMSTDLDGDGLPDVFLAGPQIWHNLGGFKFEQVATNLPASYGGLPIVGDYDNDGDPDLLLTAMNNGFPARGPSVLYRNDGNFSFQPTDVTTLPNLAVFDGAWGDVDGDGHLDLMIAAESGASSERWLYLNRSRRTNTPPSAPAGLKTIPIADGIQLEWSEAEDKEDKRFLTYNIRVGTTPGGSEILSALANPSTGRRAVSGPGNAGSVPRWRMLHLPNGDYYWTVQAIDAGYAASSFASETSFRISAPRITGPTNFTVRANVPAGPFNFSVGDDETSASDLKVSVVSQNEEIIKTANILLEGEGTGRSLSFTPSPHNSGKVTLLFTAEDRAGEISTVELGVTVRDELTQLATDLPGVSQGSAAWADIDRNGDLDLLTGGSTEAGGRVDLWRGEKGQITTNVFRTFSRAGSGQGSFNDANLDGKIDLLISGSDSTTLFFGVAEPGGDRREFGAWGSSVSGWGDRENDGKPDFVLSGLIDWPRAYMEINQLPLGFLGLPFDTYAITDGDIVWFDMDNDGDDDLLMFGTAFSDGRAALLRNDNGSLVETSTELPDLYYGGAAVADIDLDGAPDIVVSGLEDSVTQRYSTYLLHNDGTGYFSIQATPLPGMLFARVSIADYNGDDRPDILLSGISNQEPRTELWLNLETGFVKTGNSFSGQSGRGVAWGDMDGDGDLDLALIGPHDGIAAPEKQRFAAVFRNEVDHGGSAPMTPIDLQARPDGTDVILSWRMPIEAPKGLTFNIRAGTTPGGVDIMSPLADPTTGRRFVPADGNAGWSFKRRLRNWAGKSFYWSVQAIDAAYRGSPFASEQSTLTSRNDPPAISDIRFQQAEMNREIGPISFTVSDPDHDVSTLSITVRSSNQALVPDSSIVRTGNGTSQTLTLTPVRNGSGSTRITITATDPLGSSITNEFLVAVRAVSEVVNAGLAGYHPVSVHPGDYDANGTMDLLVGGWKVLSPNSSLGYGGVFTNSGTGTFSEALAFGQGMGGDIRGNWADLDGDGDLDLFTRLTVIDNENGMFGDAGSFANRGGVVECADYDGDGALDFAVVGDEFSTLLKVFHNENGSFRGVDLTPAIDNGTLAWGDPDNDGDLDLAVMGTTGGVLRIYENISGVFKQVGAYAGAAAGTVQWADANGDGRVDLLIAGNANLNSVRERLLLNLGDFNFLETDLAVNENGVSGFPGALLVDFDSDGDLDLVEHTLNGSFRVRTNNGFGQFSTGLNASANVSAKTVQAADFDNDADFDFLVGGSRFEGSIRLFRNLWLSEAASVSELTATTAGREVTVAWPNEDRFGTGSPVTYNLRMGTTPGGIDIVSPLSNPQTGKRLLPAHGNMGFAHQTRLRLAPGTYYWSIQPVDSAWRGGPFAAESTFTIAGTTPVPTVENFAFDFFTLTLNVRAAPGTFAVMESSYDLRSWRAQSTNYISSAEEQVIHLNRPDATHLFFRVRCLP